MRTVKCAALLAVSGLLFGCEPKTNADFDRSTREGCKRDADCVVAHSLMGRCCETSCAPVGAYNAEYASMVSAWHRKKCDGEECPNLLCPEARFTYDAVCSSGFCELEKTPRPGGRPPAIDAGNANATPDEDPNCQLLAASSHVRYNEASVQTMLGYAKKCVASGTLVGKPRSWVSRHFPPPIDGGAGGDAQAQNYYAGKWDTEDPPAKQVKLVFCFDGEARVASVRAAYAHQDLACPRGAVRHDAGRR